MPACLRRIFERRGARNFSGPVAERSCAGRSTSRAHISLAPARHLRQFRPRRKRRRAWWRRKHRCRTPEAPENDVTDADARRDRLSGSREYAAARTSETHGGVAALHGDLRRRIGLNAACRETAAGSLSDARSPSAISAGGGQLPDLIAASAAGSAGPKTDGPAGQPDNITWSVTMAVRRGMVGAGRHRRSQPADSASRQRN